LGFSSNKNKAKNMVKINVGEATFNPLNIERQTVDSRGPDAIMDPVTLEIRNLEGISAITKQFQEYRAATAMA
jgi:hypothetical protein